MHRDLRLDLRPCGYPMTRGEFRRAMDLAHAGRIESGDGAGQALRDLLDQIASKAPDRDPALDAAARREYVAQAKAERELGLDTVGTQEGSDGDSPPVATGSEAIMGGERPATVRDTRPRRARRPVAATHDTPHRADSRA